MTAREEEEEVVVTTMNFRSFHNVVECRPNMTKTLSLLLLLFFLVCPSRVQKWNDAVCLLATKTRMTMATMATMTYYYDCPKRSIPIQRAMTSKMNNVGEVVTANTIGRVSPKC